MYVLRFVPAMKSSIRVMSINRSNEFSTTQREKREFDIELSAKEITEGEPGWIKWINESYDLVWVAHLLLYWQMAGYQSTT